MNSYQTFYRKLYKKKVRGWRRRPAAGRGKAGGGGEGKNGPETDSVFPPGVRGV